MIETLLNELPYLISLFIITFLISKAKNIKTTKKLLFFYLLILTIIAFIFVPNENQDLYRLSSTSQNYAENTIPELLELAKNNTAPMSVIYLALIGKTKIPGLLPALTAFITFGCIFAVIYKSAKKYNLKNKSIARILFYTMISGAFLMVISNIRTLMAFAIISLCIYTEIFEEKKVIHHIVPYIFSALLHPVAIIVIIVRLFFYMLTEKNTKTPTKIISILIFLIIIIYLLSNSTLFLSITEKANSYLSKNTYKQKWEYIISGLYILFYLISFFLYYKDIEKNKTTKKILLLFLAYTTISILFISEYAIFTRFQEILLSTLYIPLLAQISSIQETDKNIEKTRNFNLIFVFFCIIVIIIACTEGNLSHYRFM